ncbi:threonine/homoserine efflux transporter RhtA [Tumebacillus sp. BK434]|uniref:DMT family transporter n=1 Tax=Tumebacillus sp. BK434 TaxID=2512169 RepID=UPI00104FF7B8|nr:EamA family transporter [Tumebacillus sp. BK434]TCP59618.1 threonine/homoserine efflux transporter RhtA [Tumebacillus sp. BK434]
MNARVKGFSMVLIGASFWGLSGTVAQKLFVEYAFTTGYLVTLRLLIAGVLMLGMAWLRGKRADLIGVWKDPRDRVGVIVFGVLGMLGVQYTYFSAIETGNAATATLLQYLAPLLVTVYLAVQLRKMPRAVEFVAVLLALLGTALLVTNGRWDGLSVPGIALFWGLISAVALAFYTLYPVGLLKRWGSEVIVGWAMLIGGVGLLLIERPWTATGQVWTGMSVALVLFVILFGTLIAFFLYLDSMRFLSPSETSLLACIEPLVAVVASVVWLHVPLGLLEIVGGLCIVGTVVILSLPKK